MGSIVLSTNAVALDEPCLELAEVNRVLPIPGASLRRVQIIRVVRNDKPWEFIRDLGPAGNFKAEQVIFPGAVNLGNGRYEVVETVERLLDAADAWRDHYGLPREHPWPRQDFVGGFEEMATREWDARVGRKRFPMYGGTNDHAGA